MAPAKILVIDDSEPIRSTLRLTLEFKGHTVVEAADGREGLEQLRGGSFDLVFCDLAMPEMDGVTLIRQVREALQIKDLPIIVLSAEERGAKLEALEAGANASIDKPFSPRQVLQTLESFLPA